MLLLFELIKFDELTVIFDRFVVFSFNAVDSSLDISIITIFWGLLSALSPLSPLSPIFGNNHWCNVCNNLSKNCNCFNYDCESGLEDGYGCECTKCIKKFGNNYCCSSAISLSCSCGWMKLFIF